MVKFKIQNSKFKILIQSLKLAILVINFTFCIFNFTLSCYAEDKIVAVVNKEVITQKDLNDFLNFMRIQLATKYQGKELENKIQSMKLDLLNKLIEDRLILRDADANNIPVDQAKVKERVEELKSRYSSEADFQHTLAQQGLTQSDVERKIREQFLTYSIIEYKVRSKIVVNPSEVTDFYEKHKAEFKVPEGREFEVITIDKEDLANDIYDKLKAGAELKDLTAQFSLNVDKLSANKDGQLNKDIEDVLFTLEVGEISKPLKIKDTFYIFKLDNIIAPRQETLLEAQDAISALLFDKKMQEAFSKWLDELKKQSYIKIFQN